MYEILTTEDYKNWFNDLTLKEKAQIRSRIVRIKIDGHFGKIRKLDKNLAELKWKNGWRVYFSFVKSGKGETVILLIGGNKNSQNKDINRARSLIYKMKEEG